MGRARLALALLMIAAAADAAERDRGAWFKSLRTPPTAAAPLGASCCDLSDCKETRARFVGGSWWAILPDTGKEAYVPPDKVLTQPKSFDGEAYICSTPPRPGGWQSYSYYGAGSAGRYYVSPTEAKILCFIPPLLYN